MKLVRKESSWTKINIPDVGLNESYLYLTFYTNSWGSMWPNDRVWDERGAYRLWVRIDRYPPRLS